MAHSLFHKGFKVVRGVYGQRVALTGSWEEEIGRWMTRHGITELECNHVNGCKLESYDFLSEIPFLTGLRIVNQDPKDFSPLSQLGGLRSLEITLVPSPRNFPFARLAKLERLTLEWFAGAEKLFTANSLKHLSIERYPGRQGSEPFRALEGLENLILANGGIEEIESFRVLRSLQRLQLVNLRQLRSLKGIENLDTLRCLCLDGSKGIGSIEEVRGLVNLQLLWLVDCGKIESLDPVRGLKKLKSLLFGGSTNIVDGDLTPLLALPDLCHWGFALDLKHYNLSRDHPHLAERRNSRACKQFSVEELWRGES